MSKERSDNQEEELRELKTSVEQLLKLQSFQEARELIEPVLSGPLRAGFIAQFAVILYLLEDPDAIDWLERAVDEADDPVMPCINLGTAREKQNRLDEARELFLKALTFEPTSSEALLGLGRVEFLATRYEEALSAFRRAHTFDRQNVKPLQHMISVFEVMGEPEDAAASYRLLMRLGDVLTVATSVLNSCVILEPSPLEAVLFEEIERDPQHVALRVLLGKYLLKRNRTVEAARLLATSNFEPERDGDWTLTLAVAYHDLGFSEKANLLLLNYLRTKEPRDFNWPPLLLLQHYLPGRAQADISRLHHIWGQHQPKDDYVRPTQLGKKRIVFVGGDFGNHPVGFFCVPLVEGLKQRGFEIHLVDTNPREDPTAQRLRATASTVRSIRALGDEEALVQVRSLEPSIAVDLSGHTRGAKLSLFSRRIAPFQFTAYGYVNTTGLAAMDGILSDPYQILHSEEDSYSETVLRLPHSYIVYEPPPWLPELSEGSAARPLTFGCLNRAAKLGPETVERFATFLLAFATARLILAAPGLDNNLVQAEILNRFQAHGVAPERIEFRGGASHASYLKNYNDFDIALDTSPYSGGLTTCEALVMGTPVVTIPQSTMASRHSLGHLTNAGFPQWVFANTQECIEGLATLAEDIKLRKLSKTTVREATLRSKLCDKERYLDDFCALLERVS